MPKKFIQHALSLHLHRPAGHLLHLLHQDEEALRTLLLCHERVARYAARYAEVARLHLVLSGCLLQQWLEPAFLAASRHLADVPALLETLRGTPNLEFIASGHWHAPLSLIPRRDWEEQLRRELGEFAEALGRMPRGYRPPATQLPAEAIPLLVELGYAYVLLDTAMLARLDGSGVDPYRPYRVCHGDACIAVVPVDAGFSRAQAEGMEAPWFADEVRNGVAQSPPADAPYLLTTCSDADAGAWLRTPDEEQGFFARFFAPYMEFCETGEFPVEPVALSTYLAQHPVSEEAVLRALPVCFLRFVLYYLRRDACA